MRCGMEYDTISDNTGRANEMLFLWCGFVVRVGVLCALSSEVVDLCAIRGGGRSDRLPHLREIDRKEREGLGQKGYFSLRS